MLLSRAYSNDTTDSFVNSLGLVQAVTLVCQVNLRAFLDNVCYAWCFFFSEIVIVQHPVSVCVPQNYKVTLSVRAVGTGLLNYQWFRSEEEVRCKMNRTILQSVTDFMVNSNLRIKKSK